MSGATKLTKIDSYAFQYSSKLATVKLASSITTIGASAFTSTKITPGTVDFNGVNCLAAIKSAGTTTKPFSWKCPNIPMFSPGQSTSCAVGIETTIKFDFLWLIDKPATRPKIKFVAPSTSCGNGTTDALAGSVGQVSFIDVNHGFIKLTLVNTVSNAKLCYRVGDASGVYSAVKSGTSDTRFTVTMVPTTAYTYDSNATCTFENNENTQCCGTFTEIIIAPDVKVIKKGAFKLCKSITFIDFSAATSLQSIGVNAFTELVQISSLDLSPATSLTIVATDAFSWCTNLTSVTLASGISEIGARSFNYGGLDTPASVDWNGVDCAEATAKAGTIHPPFKWLCPQLPPPNVTVLLTSIAATSKVATTLTFVCGNLRNGASRPYIKLVAPGTGCGSGVADALAGGSTGQLTFKSTTVGSVVLTVAAKVKNAVVCWGASSAGAYAQVGGAAVFTVIDPPPIVVSVNATVAITDGPVALTFTCTDLFNEASLPTVKLVPPATPCGNGTDGAIPGSVGKLMYLNPTSGAIVLTINAAVTDASICFHTSLVPNASSTGAYTQVGTVKFTVTDPPPVAISLDVTTATTGIASEVERCVRLPR